MPKTELESFEILGDFILCLDESVSQNSGTFWVDKGDDRLTTDNLHFFRVVKLPHSQTSITACNFTLNLGDSVVSIAVGTDVKLDGTDYKLFETKYITAKRS